MLGISKELIFWGLMADLMHKMILLLKLHIQRVRKYTLRCVLKMFFTQRTCLILERK
jgi:hypothetical protein